MIIAKYWFRLSMGSSPFFRFSAISPTVYSANHLDALRGAP